MNNTRNKGYWNILTPNHGGRGFHPTEKPLKILLDLVKNHNLKKTRVLDMFMGSGTTLVACEMVGVHGVGIEKNKKYFNTAIRRLKPVVQTPRLDSFLSA